MGERGKTAALALFGAIVLMPACGSSEEDRQDANEPEGEFPVEVSTAEFPTNQRLADTSDLELAVENIGDEQIPDLAITICIDSCNADGPFSLRSDQSGLANPNRPVWILEQDYPKLVRPGVDPRDYDDEPTAGAEAAQTNTFSFGPMAPGDETQAVWRVTPVRGGTYTVHYEVAAGLSGNAKALTADGSPAEGSFVVTISTKPPETSVDPDGKIVTEK